MFTALVTGLIYGRFAQPGRSVVFSDKALLTHYKDGTPSLQFRIANSHASQMMDVSATVLLLLSDTQDHLTRQYYELQLEYNTITFFPLSWTVVHIITEESPLYGKTEKDLIAGNAEILIMVRGYDEAFGQVVRNRYSYTIDNIKEGLAFDSAFKAQDDGFVHFHISDINKTKKAPIKKPDEFKEEADAEESKKELQEDHHYLEDNTSNELHEDIINREIHETPKDTIDKTLS